MHSQAPYQYVRDYYDHVHRTNTQFPEVASFWLSSLRHIQGGSVLNAGCGPQLYDYLLRFGRPPKDYVGLDFNRNTFEFLNRSRDPRLLEAKSRARERGAHVEFLCADVFECEEQLTERFNSVLGIGFFATFYSARFDRLMHLMHQALKPGGVMLKVTWHGPHRSAEQTREKLTYGYDSAEEPTPEVLVDGVLGAGFNLEEQAILSCDPRQVGWDAIQVCVFRKGQ
jgi:cyclopropane fatty-acyl-phospholipid synthase-like methyltransferase